MTGDGELPGSPEQGEVDAVPVGDAPVGDGPAADEPPDDHRDDGLDLARALTRATAKAGGAVARRGLRGKKPRRPGTARVSGAHPDDRDPQLLDSAVSRLVDDHGWDLDLRVHGVFGRWQELVGAEVAQHCTPESFADGKLVVRTDSTAWATQLRLLAPTDRAAPQRGARPRDGRPDRRPRPAPALLEEGAALRTRRPRPARHLRLTAAAAG